MESTPSKQRKTSPRLALRLTGSLAAICLLVYLLQRQGWEQILASISDIAWWRLALICVIMLVSRLATVGRWHMLLRGLKVGMPLRHTLSLTFAGLFASNFLPTTVGGDVARLAGAMQLGYDGVRCAASLALDRLVGMLGMLVAAPFGIPAFGAVLKPHLPLHQPGVILLSQMAPERDRPWDSVTWRMRGVIGRLLGALLQGVRSPWRLLGALAFTWVHMLCLFSIISLLLSGMGHPMPFRLIAGLWAIVYFVTLLPISINGLGVQELSVAYVFTHMGVPDAVSLTVALLMRTLMALASLPGAAFVPSVLAGARQEPVAEAEG